mgnify:CR=1 FL=1|jgi:hypothetical protein
MLDEVKDLVMTGVADASLIVAGKADCLRTLAEEERVAWRRREEASERCIRDKLVARKTKRRRADRVLG